MSRISRDWFKGMSPHIYDLYVYMLKYGATFKRKFTTQRGNIAIILQIDGAEQDPFVLRPK